jgi:predicted nucleic acid-binding protein
MTRSFVDTNILLYATSSTPAEAAKRARAENLLERDDLALSVQVLQEFYTQATRPTRPQRLSPDLARAFIRVWLRFPVQSMTLGLFHNAMAIADANRLSYWDSAIIAAAAELGCTELLSEDMQHDRRIAGLRIVNPFG